MPLGIVVTVQNLREKKKKKKKSGSQNQSPVATVL